MNRIIKILILIVSFSACSNSNDKRAYQEEALLMRYLDEFQQDKIPQEEYLLFTFRTKQLCKTCRKTPLDTVLKMVVENRGDLELYILTDNQKDMNDVMSQYGNQVHCLFGDAQMMNKYGIPYMEPLLFHIKDKKVLEVSNYFSH